MNTISNVSHADDDNLRPVVLTTLRPTYDKSKHQVYVDLLLADLTGTSPSSNIAVSGAYGTGKSSVLAGLLSELRATKIPSMQVSLATLNQSRQALLDVSGEETLTAALEKEVVKRLLYSAKPSDIPRSRFNRISEFRLAPAIGLAAVLSILISGIAYTFQTNLPTEQIVNAWRWWAWTGPILTLLVLASLFLGLQAALSSFRLSQIAVGPATLSLDDKDGNYFDHYLDEIVYFFQKTRTRVVIFEDLDRFDDAGIFLALRELNNLLNASPQISDQTTFVHAIRDSLFVATAGPGGRDSTALPDEHARVGSDTAASDRAKFFDLIVPLVPFISHEVSADLLLLGLKDLPESRKPSRPLLTLGGSYFTDMRVLHSIRNEYVIFASELLDKSSVRGLLPDHLFAMILYKHLHLDEFERIRTGTSALDASVDAIRKSAITLLSALDKSIADAEDALDAAAAVERRAAAAGERLLANLEIIVRHRGWQNLQSIGIDGGSPFSLEDVSGRDFWVALAKSDSPVFQIQTSHGVLELPTADIHVLLGRDRNPRTWTRDESQRDRQTYTRLVEAREWFRSASFSKLLSGPFPVAESEGGWKGPAEACLQALGPGLPFDLFRHGYLDQNFALYTTKFHGEILSADARSYLMQYVDRHRSEPLFKLSSADVDEICDRVGPALLSDESALNVAIVDRLIETEGRSLPALLEASGQSVDFVITYLSEGKYVDAFLRRLTGLRSDLLDIIVAAATFSDSERQRLLSICLSVLSGEVDYETSATTVELLTREFASMPVAAEVLTPDTAAAVANLLSVNGIWVEDLSLVAEPLRRELASAGSFAVNRRGLDSIAPESGKIGLDSLGGLEDGVGLHLLLNLADYAASLREVPAGYIVDELKNLDLVVRGVIAVDPALLAETLRVRVS